MRVHKIATDKECKLCVDPNEGGEGLSMSNNHYHPSFHAQDQESQGVTSGCASRDNDFYYVPRKHSFETSPSRALRKSAKALSPQKPVKIDVWTNPQHHVQHSQEKKHQNLSQQASSLQKYQTALTNFFNTEFLTPGGQRIYFNFTAVNIPTLPMAPVISNVQPALGRHL